MRGGVLLLAALCAGLLPVATASAGFPGKNGKIVFVSNRDGNTEIYSMNADGSGQANLTHNAASDDEPSVSADGSKVAFSTNRGANNFDVWTMNADGSGLKRVTSGARSEASPAFTPSGRILFRSAVDGDYEIYSINPDGSGERQLTQNTGIQEYDPVASPDGSKIAYSRESPGSPSNVVDIWSMNADGSGQTRLTTADGLDFKPSWAPNNLGIAFASTRDPNSEIYAMNPNGSGQVNVTRNGAGDATPAWSPDGAKIAFTTVRGGNTADIYSTNANGSAQTPLTTSPGDDYDPDWARQPVTCATAGGITDATDAHPGNGVVEGTAGYDLLRGGPGNDTLDGKGGNDVLCGEGGDDTLIGGPGTGADADVLDGGPGKDTASYSARTSYVNAKIGDGPNDGALGENDDVLASTESLTGGSTGDRLTGDGGPNTLSGGGGADLIDGGAGDDTLDGGPGTGPDGDFLFGGTGADTVTYANRTAKVFVDLNAANDTSATEGQSGEGDSVYSDVEYVLTGSGPDDVRGNSASNYIATGAGNDSIVGGAGQDFIDAGAGDDADINIKDGVVDILICGSGVDTLSASEYDANDLVGSDCERG